MISLDPGHNRHPSVFHLQAGREVQLGSVQARLVGRIEPGQVRPDTFRQGGAVQGCRQGGCCSQILWTDDVDLVLFQDQTVTGCAYREMVHHILDRFTTRLMPIVPLILCWSLSFFG